MKVNDRFQNTKITLSGKDEDAPDTPNSQIEFVKISKIQRNVDGIAQNDPPQDLFVIETGDNNEGILTLNLENLRNYYGNLVLTISVCISFVMNTFIGVVLVD